MSGLDPPLLVKDGAWKKRATAKECWQPLEAANGLPVTANKKQGLQSYNCKEQNSANSLNEQRNGFFPGASITECSLQIS